MHWCRLDFVEGDFRLLFKSEIPGSKHQIIRAYHLELQQELSGMPVWTPEEADTALYKIFAPYYRKVAELLGIECDRLTQKSRHFLLVCTEPVCNDENLRPGLSFLEKLMGYSLEAKVQQESKSSVPTTGDYVLDIKTDLYLIFKRHAPKLWKTHSLEECALLCRQANERMKDPDDIDDGEGWGKKVEVVDDEIFLEKKQEIILGLNAIGVKVPEGF